MQQNYIMDLQVYMLLAFCYVTKTFLFKIMWFIFDRSIRWVDQRNATHNLYFHTSKACGKISSSSGSPEEDVLNHHLVSFGMWTWDTEKPLLPGRMGRTSETERGQAWT